MEEISGMRVGAAKLRRMESREGRALFCTCRSGHHGFFCGLGKRAAAVGGLSRMGRGAVTLQTSPQLPGNPGRECLYCLFKMRANKRFVQGEENTRCQGREGSF